MRGDVFDRETMWKPLREIVAEKIGHYAKSRLGFDDLSLLIVYNQAWIYNSPAETPLHSFDDAAAALRRMIRDNRGAFDRVFLYIALEPGRVLVFLGVKGGVGTTTIVLNTAAILARQKKSVIALELRSYGGSFGSQTLQDPSRNLKQLLDLEPERITPAEIRKCLMSLRGSSSETTVKFS